MTLYLITLLNHSGKNLTVIPLPIAAMKSDAKAKYGTSHLNRSAAFRLELKLASPKSGVHSARVKDVDGSRLSPIYTASFFLETS